MNGSVVSSNASVRPRPTDSCKVKFYHQQLLWSRESTRSGGCVFVYPDSIC